MSITMSGSIDLPASRSDVWEKLLDAACLKDCIPGCETLEQLSPTQFHAVVRTRIGPISARFKGSVTLEDLVENEGCRIVGEGEGGVAGFAKGGANVRLADGDGSTILTYEADAQIGGKMAQLGSRLVSSVAKRLADEFFANFAKRVSGTEIG
jgi:carbon monoxide dehydrogenase subunit G